MDDKTESDQLKSQPVDYLVSAIKGTLGAIPFAGSLLAELASTVIPNQRIDRIAMFAQVLDKKLAKLDQEFVRSQLADEQFTDLLEEGIRQATRSLNDDRREFIANLITYSLSQHDIEYNESKHLMRILSELNDIEIVWLRFYLEPTMNGDEEFRNKHANILTPVMAVLNDPPHIHDKESLQNSYTEHLTQLGLLETHYKTDMATHVPVYNRFTGAPEVQAHEITRLGSLLLRQIGLQNPE